MTTQNFKQLATAVIQTELNEIEQLLNRLDDSFTQACQLMFDCTGRIVVIGMGKSGHIGSKIAATLASTGSPAFFVHPGEASHGDLGMIMKNDVVLAISNSGETDEIITIVPLIKRLGVPLISLTGNAKSHIATQANVNLDVSVSKEACPLGLAPTSSTTVALVMGDALAIALLDTRGFTADDFALSHPGGRLGKRLLLHVKDIMHIGSEIPMVQSKVLLSQALIEMTEKKLGMTTIIDPKKVLIGVFTDGDLRRILERDDINLNKTTIDEVMIKNCKVIYENQLAAEALQIMESKSINALPVVNNDNELIGALNMHDLLRAGVV
ncbi:D-arabinose 5-phosphate isomerase [hydrothermal vent metagenome]|uniref:D-arabinose 5-phosphate isomerase n=1 Tax=hydrothermal vent metagenome TaxID=652676 RepID=A0A3B1A0L8_9ZZZZ